MDTTRIEVELTSKPAPGDIRALEEGLEGFNRSRTAGAYRTKVPIAVWMRREGRIIGGAYGDTRSGWLYLSLLWVDESLRGQGWGKQLLERFENEAIARDCHAAWVDTYGFQAPGFYEKLGYREFGRLDNFPRAVRREKCGDQWHEPRAANADGTFRSRAGVRPW